MGNALTSPYFDRRNRPSILFYRAVSWAAGRISWSLTFWAKFRSCGWCRQPPGAEHVNFSSLSKLAFLNSEPGAALLRRALEAEADDLQLAAAPWLRNQPAFWRTAVLEQRALRLRARAKHRDADRMLFTPLGLQQMTPEPLARYKAGRLPAGVGPLADLCCGLGGDSLHVPAAIPLLGVDLHGEILRAYRHNVGLFRPAMAVRADAARFQARVEGILLDPARRALAHGVRHYDADPEPGWEAVLSLVARFRNAVVKLGPGARVPAELLEYECEYLGWRDSCLELTVRTGDFGRAGSIRAVELPAQAVVEAASADLETSFGRVEDPGDYLYEPVKCVVRAHLFGVLAQREGLWQLDGRLAYLSGPQRPPSPLWKCYRLKRVLPCDAALLRRELGKHDVGILEIKKRGIDIDPEAWRRRLQPRGPASATLVFTRLRGRAAVLWVEPEAGSGL